MSKDTNKKSVVLLSGGLDSSTVAYLRAKKSKPYSHHRVYTLTFDYGQRHRKELGSAFKVSKNIGAYEHKIVKFNLRSWGGSSLTDKNIKLPKGSLKRASIPNTYVPARNTIFLSFALSYAEAIGAEEIYIGVNSLDYSGYVDCRKEFIKKFQELIGQATVAGVKGRSIKIKAPLINLTKAQIVKLGNKLHVDWKSTWSCYSGDKKACGQCDSCLLRLKGFAQAGVRDPLLYKKYPKFYREFL